MSYLCSEYGQTLILNQIQPLFYGKYWSHKAGNRSGGGRKFF